jgi:protein-tyrosine phosphatase
MSTALSMARLAADNGIEKLVLTPHIQPGLYENTRAGIESVLVEYQQEIEKEGIPLDVRAAAEVRITPEIRQMLAADELPFLGELNGYKVFLLEFPHSHIPPGSDRLIDWLLNHDIRPLIAHPERNKEVIRKLDKIIPFVSAGCLLQVTAGSIAGRFGEQCQLRAREMLEQGWVTVLASDAHNLNHRVPDLGPGRMAAADIVGEEASWQLVRDNPWSIVNGLFE